jgi:hypothetical protein
MQITLTFDPNSELAEVQSVLDSLGKPSQAGAAPTPVKPASSRKPRARAAEPEPELEDEDQSVVTLEDCVSRAQELVGEKRTEEVKAAIKEIGVERVSKLKTAAQRARFMELVASDSVV